ncbi:hypothetical protein NDU88_004307 [Pleurodeles waltl]|uniref:Uncharacterized protein n=1 Tax=Pleurodeles waltl TaxID=8319 RepID=A0AAV7W8P9_PLEWA|nr:hypothetical protein NDU88_004307 [Pleurodeles waltl]
MQQSIPGIRFRKVGSAGGGQGVIQVDIQAGGELDPLNGEEDVNLPSDSITDMLKALAMELNDSFKSSKTNQEEIRNLCEDLGKKIDDLAGRTAALEEEIISWARDLKVELGGTNELEDQCHLEIPLKKEVARWYWLIMDIVDGDFTLPEELQEECLPERQHKDLWQSTDSLRPRLQAKVLALQDLTTVTYSVTLLRMVVRSDKLINCINQSNTVPLIKHLVEPEEFFPDLLMISDLLSFVIDNFLNGISANPILNLKEEYSPHLLIVFEAEQLLSLNPLDSPVP